MLSRFVTPFFDAGSGIKPSVGAKLLFTATGTSTPKDTFNCPDGTTANSNPVIADANGLFPDIFFSGTFKVILKDRNDVQIWEADPVSSVLDESTIDRLNPDTLAIWQNDISARAGDVVTTKERLSGKAGGATGDVISGTGTANGRDKVANNANTLTWELRDSDTECQPLKYGADPDTDQTALINILLVENRDKRNVLLDAPYIISSTVGNSALIVHEAEGLVAPRFDYWRSSANDAVLRYKGTGDAVELLHSDTVSSVEGAVLENVVIRDEDGTGVTGLKGGRFVACRLKGAVSGFDNAILCDEWFFYTRMDFQCREYRLIGAAYAGNMNAGGLLKLQLSSAQATVTDGLNIGSSVIFPSTQTTSNGPIIDASVENSNGKHITINLMQGGKLDLYTELGNDSTNIVTLTNLQGTDIGLFVSAKEFPDRAVVIDTGCRDCNVRGFINGGNLFGLKVGATCVGINLAGLITPNVEVTGDFATGRLVGGTVATGDQFIREAWGRAGVRPSLGTYSRGSRLKYHNVSVVSNRINEGAMVTTSGTEGTLTDTVSGTISTDAVTVTDRTKYHVGDIINIATVAGDYTVLALDSPTLIRVKPDLASTFSGQAATFKAPAYTENWTSNITF